MSLKTIVTARNTVNDEQIYVRCSNVSEALNIAGKIHQIELKERTYSQVRLRSSPVPKKLYKDMTAFFLNNGA